MNIETDSLPGRGDCSSSNNGVCHPSVAGPVFPACEIEGPAVAFPYTENAARPHACSRYAVLSGSMSTCFTCRFSKGPLRAYRSTRVHLLISTGTFGYPICSSNRIALTLLEA